RLSQRWFVLIAKPVAETEAGAVNAASGRRGRFGVTVGKRPARRAVDRVLVKRLLREAARHAGPQLSPIAPVRMNVVLRWKAPLPVPNSVPRGQTKRALRADADELLARLLGRLSERAAAGKTT